MLQFNGKKMITQTVTFDDLISSYELMSAATDRVEHDDAHILMNELIEEFARQNPDIESKLKYLNVPDLVRNNLDAAYAHIRRLSNCNGNGKGNGNGTSNGNGKSAREIRNL